MEEGKTGSSKRAREGLVVWDQQGLVVVWPDGQSRRFSWETLQHLSLCPTCHQHGAQQSSASQYISQLT
jgi:hypothetical protein